MFARFSVALGICSLVIFVNIAPAADILPATIPLVGDRVIQQWRDSSALQPTTLPTQIPRNDMLVQYTLNQADQAWRNWQQAYEQRKTPEQIAANQQRLRHRFVEALGGFPARTPLNARIVGTIQREGYRVEKVLFESQPKFYVTANLFLPDAARFKPPYPGVIVPCGHHPRSKAWDEYQSMGALLALNGMVGLVYDPIEQGERRQFPQTDLWGTTAHDLIGVGSILLGRSTATFEVWDGMRAIDYLQSRPEVDPKRIGCTGNSGGGTQTSYLMSLDERIVVAAPSCFIGRVGSQIRHSYGDAEQQIFGQLAWGMDHPDYLSLQAPQQRVIVLAATRDFFDVYAAWNTFRYAKRVYTRLGYPERIDIMENDEGHNYNKDQRQAAVRWMARWLLGRDEPINEPQIALIPDKDLECAPGGNVMQIQGAKSSYDLNEDIQKELAATRKQLWATAGRSELLDRVRRLASIRKLNDLPEPLIEKVATEQAAGHRIDRLIIKPEPGIFLPALLLVPDQPKGAVLFLGSTGQASQRQNEPAIQECLKSGQIVLTVDLRGMGETGNGDDWTQAAGNYRAAFTAYMLERSLVGMWAEDILVCSRHLASQLPAGQKTVQLVATGSVCVPSLHAAALETGLYESVTLKQPLLSWTTVISAKPPDQSQVATVVNGALRVYDLPDLASVVGQKLRIER